MRPASDLREQQRFIVTRMMEHRAALIVSAMGSGKTAAALTAARALLDTFTVRRVLVIAPLRVAKDTWPDEIEAWEHTSVLNVAVAVGPDAQRRAAIDSGAEITVMNRENLPWLSRHLGSVEKWPFDCVIVDESSAFKAGKKRTTKSRRKDADGKVVVSKGGKITRFGVLAAARRRIDRIYLLTGTPAPNGLEDLWGQIYLLDQGERLGMSQSAFFDRWFDRNPYTMKITARPHAEKEIMDLISDVMISLPPLELVPPPVFVPIKVQLPPAVMTEYRRFERTLVSEVHDVEAVSKGVLTNKLLQFCIARETPVLTGRGWVPIQSVTATDEVWDGVEWVRCGGAAAMGKQPVVSCFGVQMTSNHRVLTKEGWATAQRILNGKSSEKLARAEVRLPDRGRAVGLSSDGTGEQREGALARRMRVREAIDTPKSEPSEHASSADEVVRVSSRRADFTGSRRARSHDDRQSTLGHLAANEKPLPQSEVQGLSQLRRSRNRYAGPLVRFLQRILGRCAEGVFGRTDHRPDQQQQELRAAELPLDYDQEPNAEYAGQRPCEYAVGEGHSGGSRRASGPKISDRLQTLCSGRAGQHSSAPRPVEVFDILDCGPRHRFVVRGGSGPLIVHNCNGSMYREDGSVAAVHTEKLDALDDLIERATGDPVLVFYGFRFDLAEICKRHPDAVVLNESDTAVKDWNAGKIRVLLAHPASCAHGLNLQYGGHIAIWFGLTWSLELYLQANARLPRPGQKNLVAIYQIIAEGTADENVLAVLDRKEITQDAITEAVRARILDAG